MDDTRLTNESRMKTDFIRGEVYHKELTMCKKLNRENQGKCAWGKCKECGVIPLLFKLYKGQLLEDPNEINEVKAEVFQK